MSRIDAGGQSTLYVPKGHLEEFAMSLLKGAGFAPYVDKRGYVVKSNSADWFLKLARPQDQPYLISNGGTAGIVGEDILQEFVLEPKNCGSGRTVEERNLTVVGALQGRPTKLVAMIKPDNLKGPASAYDVENIGDVIDLLGEELRVASEYPNIVEDYLRKEYGINVEVYKPAGGTEGLLIGPAPEMDIVVDTIESGETARQNNLKLLDELMASSQVFLANAEQYEVPSIKYRIDNLWEQFQGVMRAKEKNLQRLDIDVLNSTSVDGVVEYLIARGYSPTVSEVRVREGMRGADVFVVVPDSEIKEITPTLAKLGASDILVSPIQRLLYPR